MIAAFCCASIRHRRELPPSRESTNSLCEKSLRSRLKKPTFGDRTPVALPPLLFRTQLPASAAASRAPSLSCPTRIGRSISCSLKCSTRSACRVHLPPQHSNIESAGTRDCYQYGCAIAFGSRTTDAPRSACGRSHAKVIFEHATVAHLSSGSWRPRYSATHGAVPRLLAASTTESTLGAREPREKA